MSDANDSAGNPAPSPATPTPDGSTADVPTGTPDITQLALEQSNRTTAEFTGSENNKPPGYKGTGRPAGVRDSKKRKSKVSLGAMGAPPGSPLPPPTDGLGDSFAGDPLAGVAPDSDFDEETAEAFVDLAWEVVNFVRTEVKHARALQITGDDMLANQFSARPVSEKLVNAIRKGGVLWAKLEHERFKLHPGYMVVGGLVGVIGNDIGQLRRLKLDHAKLQEQNGNSAPRTA